MSEKKFYQPMSGNEMPRFGGPATFMRLPAVELSDELDAAFIGVPFDIGASNRPGARLAPREIRDESRMLRPFNVSTCADPFNSLTVADVRRETPDCVSIAFDVPDDLREDYGFTAGQYLTLKTEVEGREVRRSYSISSGPTDGELRVAIRQVEGGLFSTFANENIGRGDRIDVMKPDGRFVLRPEADREGQYVCICAVLECLLMMP